VGGVVITAYFFLGAVLLSAPGENWTTCAG
jgi:hypothetical protein